MYLSTETKEDSERKTLIDYIKGAFNYWNVNHYKGCGKRIWDLSAAIPIFIFISPLLLALSIFIKLDSRGPVIFKQKRIGKDGKVFDVYKFRTMHVDTDFSSFTTTENDPRITRAGKFMRPISLDELPQLINIIKGDMSFIGPRPISEEEYNNVKSLNGFPEKVLHDLVPGVRPGILGLAIFYGREKISYENRCKLNNLYEEKQSLLFDSYISWLTLKKYWLSYLIVVSLFITIPVAILLII
jgi:O-antigen biosynthesis protein WbqP